MKDWNRSLEYQSQLPASEKEANSGIKIVCLTDITVLQLRDHKNVRFLAK